MKKVRFYKKILVIKPSSLGDIVHSLPFLNALKSGFPKAEIHWVVAKGFEGLLQGHPMINRIIVINKDIWKKITKTSDTIREVKQLFRELKNEKYDLVVDLQGLLRSGLIAMATRSPHRIGFAEAREGSRLFYNMKVKGGREVHAVDRYLKIAEALGCDTGEIIFPFPLIGNGLADIERLKKSMGRYAVIVPGARWDTKVWPAENFGRLAKILPVRSVVVGGGSDVIIAETVVKSSDGKAISLAGSTDLRELISIMKDASLVISNDSGPMHIAAAFNVPVAAIFGPTSPVRTGPYGNYHAVITSNVKCAPCFKKKCKDMLCMKEISPEKVYEVMQKCRVLHFT